MLKSLTILKRSTPGTNVFPGSGFPWIEQDCEDIATQITAQLLGEKFGEGTFLVITHPEHGLDTRYIVVGVERVIYEAKEEIY